MAYQNNYGPRPHMYNTGGANAGHFPDQQLPPQQQQQQQFYPSPYPQSAAPSPSYVQPQGSPGPANQVSRQPYLSNRSHGNGGSQLIPPPTLVPDDTFKKPYLPQQRNSDPQQQYVHNAQSPPFNPRYNQQQPTSTTPPISITSTVTSREPSQPPTTGFSYAPVSSMTAPTLPATLSTQVTTPPESPSRVPDPAETSKTPVLDQERIEALLNVNNLLLQEVQVLQKAGLKVTAQSPQQANLVNASSPQTKPDAVTPTSTDPAEATSQNAPTPSSVTTPTTTTPTTILPPQHASNNPTQNQKKFVEYMGRLKANIYYLVAMSNQDKTKQGPKPQYPTLLELPPAWLAEGLNEDDQKRFEALKEGYIKLRELWPDWKPTPRPTPQQLIQQQQAQQLAQKQTQQQQAIQPQAQQQQTQMQEKRQLQQQQSQQQQQVQ